MKRLMLMSISMFYSVQAGRLVDGSAWENQSTHHLKCSHDYLDQTASRRLKNKNEEKCKQMLIEIKKLRDKAVPVVALCGDMKIEQEVRNAIAVYNICISRLECREKEMMQAKIFENDLSLETLFRPENETIS